MRRVFSLKADSAAMLSTQELMEIRKLRVERNMSFSEAASKLGYSTEGGAVEDPTLDSNIVLTGRTGVPGKRLVLAHDPYTEHSEQIRALRTELLLRSQSSDLADCVALLSPCAGEGRSQMSAELAIAFAQLGRATLLVDADLRHSQQHVLFNADNQHGLSQAIADNKLPLLYDTKGLPSLSLLTAGPAAANPLELLSDSRFETLVDNWRHQYDFIVFDTPPIHKYADGLAVATVVGRVLTLSRARHTPYSKMQRMLRRLSATQSQVLGAVINHF